MADRMTDAELVAAYDHRDWSTLWQQGLALVRPTIARLNRQGCSFRYDEDTLQQAALYVGEVLRNWRPIESTFSDWVLSRAGWRLRAWRHAQLRAEAPEDGDTEEAQHDRTLECTTYEDPPEGFDDPLAEAIRRQGREAVQHAVAEMRYPEDRDAVTAVYGLDGMGGMTADDYALATGTSVREVYRVLGQARALLALTLRAA